MSTTVLEIYDALRSIGVADDKATAAAAEMHARFAAVDREFGVVRRVYRSEFAAVRSDLNVLTIKATVIIVFLLALGVPTLMLLLRMAIRAGAIG